jgi:hypothetical protein
MALVDAVAKAVSAIDAVCPAYRTRTGRQYQAGIGPYPENAAMGLVAEHLARAGFGACGEFIAYPSAPRQKCDLWFGDPVEWVVEAKMGRFRGDNGKPDDTGIKDLISPFPADRSALTDGLKLANSGFPARKALLVYGFDDAERPLERAIDALDVLLRRDVTASERQEAVFAHLRHPVFQCGRVVAWEVRGTRRESSPR